MLYVPVFNVPVTLTDDTFVPLTPILAFRVTLEANIDLPIPNKAPFNVPPLKVTV